MEVYTQEAIQSLLNWAQETLNNKTYPEGQVKVNKSSTILDAEKFLESMISIISNNMENPLFQSTVSQLVEFKKKIGQ